ncbi:ricin-type beta-trefoil lectin domain protein [Streptomyces sp. SID7499]|uniref:Ricin-type beta-trefoil lectin domain protein n=1 Tax=Streptomyces sp. SID7499 TaxID=2706086 RepID=A0A6G3WS12_9ACTN|nr:ricin-type beta-trefoil lectin domain protein [Streptomyces sp. SID7499]
MTATAIDRPQEQAGPVGRPGKAVLAGAAVVGALLVSVPFLVLGGHVDKDRETSSSAGTVLGGNAQDAPGEFAVTDSGSPSPSGSGKGAGKDGNKPEKTVRESTASAAAKGKGAGGSEDTDKGESKKSGEAAQPKKKQNGGTKADEVKNAPAGGGSGVTLSSPVALRSHLSGRCIDVPWSDFSDGAKLFVWDCNGSQAQQWRFASDGTIRMKDKCLDVANADFSDGTPIQIAWCNGNNAQKFVLNGAHDLVNTVVGKCVDIKDNNRDNGAWLVLFSCNGGDNQKWSV